MGQCTGVSVVKWWDVGIGEGKGMGGVGKGRCEEVRGRYGRVYDVSVGKCVGLWGRWGERYGGLGGR